jgi:hypothetical protein
MLTKELYKLEILIIKFLPFILAILEFIKTILNLNGIVIPLLGFLSHTSVLSLIFLLTTSFVFKFCKWHRLPLYYIGFNQTLNILDYYYFYNISDLTITIVYSLLFGLFSITCLILKYFNK